jgi:hypothetical protein
VKTLPRDKVASYGLHIETKFIGPTNHKPDRVKATCNSALGRCSVTRTWQYCGDGDEEHYNAALELCKVLAERNEYCSGYEITGMSYNDSSAGYFFIASPIL